MFLLSATASALTAAGAGGAVIGTHALYGGAVTAAQLAAGSAAAAGAAAGTGLSISSILQGTAGVTGLVAAISSGNAEAASLSAEAADAEREKGFEVVQNVERRRGLLAAASESIGEADVAYGASGLDLSFGSANEARRQVFREVDLAADSDTETTRMRLDRLGERARGFRRLAKQSRRLGLVSGLGRGLGVASSLQQQV